MDQETIRVIVEAVQTVGLPGCVALGLLYLMNRVVKNTEQQTKIQGNQTEILAEMSGHVSEAVELARSNSDRLFEIRAVLNRGVCKGGKGNELV